MVNYKDLYLQFLKLDAMQLKASQRALHWFKGLSMNSMPLHCLVDDIH